MSEVGVGSYSFWLYAAMQEDKKSDFFVSPARKELFRIGLWLDPMKHIYLSLSAIFFVCLGASAQMMPTGPAIPVERLIETPRSVHVGNYAPSLPETKVEFTGTALMPKARGTAKVEAARGGLKVQVRVEGLGPASQIDPSDLTYVLWAIPPNQSKVQNLGELVLKGEESTVTGFTNLSTFAMVVTAEPYFAVKEPSAMIVLQNTLPSRPDDADVVRADLLPLRRDSKTPLDIYEARNAVRIARRAGAERYAAEPFHKALQLLQQAESIFAHKKGQDIPDVKEKAREATEAAEDARAVATERGQESRPLPAADAQGAANLP
jgi:hypothetical protein